MKSLPKYRKHRASGQAVVTIAGKYYHLRPHGTRSTELLYDRLVAEFRSAGRSSHAAGEAEQLIVTAILRDYCGFAQGYYVKYGRPTNDLGAMIIGDIKKLYGTVPAAQFGPKALNAVKRTVVRPRG